MFEAPLSQYTDDPRIVLAANLLAQLAKEPADSVPTEMVAELSKHRGPAFCTAVYEAARDTGFRVLPETLAEFVEHVLRKLEHPTGASLAAVLPSGEMVR